MYFKLLLILFVSSGFILSEDDTHLKMGISIKGGVITHVAPPTVVPEPQAQASPASTPAPAPTPQPSSTSAPIPVQSMPNTTANTQPEQPTAAVTK